MNDMKKNLYIPGAAAVLITTTGVLFKINHLPGASIILTTGIALLVILFLPLALSDHFRVSGNRKTLPLYIVAWMLCLLVFAAILFKIVQGPRTDQSSASRINDALVLSHHYKDFDRSLARVDEFFTIETGSPEYRRLLMTIDSTLKLIDECREKLLDNAGFSVEQWNLFPVASASLDSREAVRKVMFSGARPLRIDQLQGNLEVILESFSQVTVLGDLSRVAPILLKFGGPGHSAMKWRSEMFSENHLSWVLVYLESLKVNLKMLRLNATLKSY